MLLLVSSIHVSFVVGTMGKIKSATYEGTSAGPSRPSQVSLRDGQSSCPRFTVKKASQVKSRDDLLVWKYSWLDLSGIITEYNFHSSATEFSVESIVLQYLGCPLKSFLCTILAIDSSQTAVTTCCIAGNAHWPETFDCSPKGLPMVRCASIIRDFQ